jgi:guanosine-3',5'-bis(diphosphate) 3'-pyrophosphohydrolase
VQKAYAFAQKAHASEVRYSGEPYFMHPAAVAKHLAQLGMDATTVAAGLLHDTIEDAHVTEEEIKKEFGPEVFFLVDGVTKLGKHKYRGAERHAESLRRLLVATSADVRVLIIKLTDRYHNMTTIEHVPAHKRERIAVETLEIYAPLADRLGMGQIKKELEDMSFPIINPEAYAHAVEVRKLKTKETDAGLTRVQKELRYALGRKGIKDFKTEIRIKGLWSLHEKLRRKDDDITRIHDIAALRLVVPTVDDCYTALGVVHSLWKPLPGEFKDYIAFPKPNGYQSLHTTLLTSDAGVVEVQIRTTDMHHKAQYGIASHMSYKQLGKTASKGAFERLSIPWIRDLVPALLHLPRKVVPPAEEIPRGAAPVNKKKVAGPVGPAWLAELANAHGVDDESEEFVEGLKRDFFSHRVFVFTPNGDVVDLPVNSTPVDFAYAIHSELGNHLSGAMVNSKLVTFDTRLRNGDIVKIIDKPAAHPTAKWIEYARTSMARRHIRTALEQLEKGIKIPSLESKKKKTRKGKL